MKGFTQIRRNAFRIIFLLGACLLLASCSTARLETGATQSFFELHDAGKLSGFASTDHGLVQTQALPLDHKVTYPASIVIYATRQNDPAQYFYTFTKPSASSQWQLTNAWRISPGGKREDLKVENPTPIRIITHGAVAGIEG